MNLRVRTFLAALVAFGGIVPVLVAGPVTASTRQPVSCDSPTITAGGITKSGAEASVQINIQRSSLSCPLGFIVLRAGALTGTAKRQVVTTTQLAAFPIPGKVNGTATATRLPVQNECGVTAFAPLIVDSNPGKLAIRQACQPVELTVVYLPTMTARAVHEPIKGCAYVGIQVLKAQASTGTAVRVSVTAQTLSIAPVGAGDGDITLQLTIDLIDGSVDEVRSAVDAPDFSDPPGDSALQASCES